LSLQRWLLGPAASLAGAALLYVPAGYYHIARIECSQSPSAIQHVIACTAYLLAIALLTAGWKAVLRATASPRQRPSGPPLGLGAVLLLGSAVHLLALIGLPFLSSDPLFYAALGRAAERFHAPAYARLCDTLPPSDPFFTFLLPNWRCGTNPYGPGWSSLTALIAHLGGDSLPYQLRLYQLLGLLAMVGTAALTGLAAQASLPSGKTGNRGAWAAALVLFSPLAIIEGTASAHNDAFLALTAAGCALCIAHRRHGLAGLALLSGLLIKISALILGGFYLLWQPMQWIRRHPRWVWPLTLALLLALVGTAAVGWTFWPLLRPLTIAGAYHLVGSPDDPLCHCTRSVECLPRAFLHFVLHVPTVSWGIGLAFRGFAALWLFWATYRGTQLASGALSPLRWAAIFLLFYYLYLHGYMQSWYFLSLLPLLPYLPDRLLRPAQVLCVSAVAYYVFYIPVHCAFSPATPVLVALSEVAQALTVIAPPTVALLQDRQRPPADPPN